MRVWQVLCAVTVVAGCGGSQSVVRPQPPMSLESLRSRILDHNRHITSFRNESVMDYWVGKTRVKGTVWILGKKGRYMRFNALAPTGDSVVADLACDGDQFAFLDFANNCQLRGACDRYAIFQFLRLQLEPDDFVLLANGSTPLIEGEGKVTWDKKKGHEVITLRGKTQTQSIRIKRQNGQISIVSSAIFDLAGTLQWSVENRDFAKDQLPNSSLRLPRRTRMRQPAEKSDLIVHWKKRTINISLSEEKFVLTPDPLIPQCQ